MGGCSPIEVISGSWSRRPERGGDCGSDLAEESRLSELMPDIPILLSRFKPAEVGILITVIMGVTDR
jgi:hypothetical protein